LLVVSGCKYKHKFESANGKRKKILPNGEFFFFSIE